MSSPALQFQLDKRSAVLSVPQQPIMYGSALPSPSVLPPPFSEYDGTWTPDATSNHLERWQEAPRRGAMGMPGRFSQAYLSDCRTTINDSPAYQPMILPDNPVSLPCSMPASSSSHVPRGVDYLDAGASDREDLSDTSSTSQWSTWTFPYNDRTTHDPRYSRSSTSSPDWSPQLPMQMPYETQSWNNMMMEAPAAAAPYTPQQAMSLNGYMFPHRFSPIPSPSPPPTYQESVLFQSRPKPEPNSSRGGVDGTGNVKKCSHCQATSTPLWRRDPTTFKPLCNACGLYLQQRNRHRPQELIEADTDDGDTTDDSDQNYVGPECSHCRTHHTSVWRRSKTGAQLCNACGVYQRLRGKPRPLSLKRNKIKPRSKHPKT